MTKKYSLVFCFLLMCLTLSAQRKDFGIWSQLTLEKKITPRLAIGLTESVRLNENASRVNTHYSQVKINYKVARKINLVLGYRNAQKFSFDEKTDYRQRFQLDFIYKLKIKKLKIELQERFQTQFENIGRSDNALVPEFYYRTRATLSYNLNRKITPYCSAELFVNQDLIADKIRCRLGFSYDFDKRNSVKAYYMLDQQIQRNDPLGFYALGLGYKFSF